MGHPTRATVEGDVSRRVLWVLGDAGLAVGCVTLTTEQNPEYPRRTLPFSCFEREVAPPAR